MPTVNRYVRLKEFLHFYIVFVKQLTHGAIYIPVRNQTPIKQGIMHSFLRRILFFAENAKIFLRKSKWTSSYLFFRSFLLQNGDDGVGGGIKEGLKSHVTPCSDIDPVLTFKISKQVLLVLKLVKFFREAFQFSWVGTALVTRVFPPNFDKTLNKILSQALASS